MPALQTVDGAISCGDRHAAPDRGVYVEGKPVILLGDLSAGHAGFPPTAAVEASSNVFVNGIPLVRFGDAYVPHRRDDVVHVERRGTQQTTVFANG